jgi:transposase
MELEIVHGGKMAYSASFRKKVLDYRKKHDLSLRATAEHFKIGFCSIARWQTRPAPAQTRAKPPLKIPDEALSEDVKKYPDDFQHERASRFGVTAPAICLALKRLKLSRKKNTKTSCSK